MMIDDRVVSLARVPLHLEAVQALASQDDMSLHFIIATFCIRGILYSCATHIFFSQELAGT